MILASAYLGGGEPARGTELGYYMLRSTVNGVRSAFFVGGRVLLVSEYGERYLTARHGKFYLTTSRPRNLYAAENVSSFCATNIAILC